MKLKCRECGNGEDFLESIEATVHVDGEGLFSPLHEAQDIWSERDYRCVVCGSWNVKDEEEDE